MLRNRCFSVSPVDETVINSTFDQNTTNLLFTDSFYEPEEYDFVCTLSNGMRTCNDVPFIHNQSNYSICKKSDFNPFKNSISFEAHLKLI